MYVFIWGIQRDITAYKVLDLYGSDTILIPCNYSIIQSQRINTNRQNNIYFLSRRNNKKERKWVREWGILNG